MSNEAVYRTAPATQGLLITTGRRGYSLPGYGDRLWFPASFIDGATTPILSLAAGNIIL